ncbi:ABC transporter permease [Thioclava kandeliae]|uniref:ABC transporter permease n=1 Tax=Thioclava kandeliae TaxID=3070818 RepID=A0ABV1SLM5_9RHOB
MIQKHRFLKCTIVFGLCFLYLPIFSMMVFSFNASSFANIWGGFSFKWYLKLLDDRQLVEAGLLSLKIAAFSATIATVLGTMVALALTRFRAFKGRALLSGAVVAPMMLPQVITGIAMLMLFILMAKWFGWPRQRGFMTVTIAHATYSIAFVTTIVQSRLGSMDGSIEEAAQDLGSRQWQVLRDVTLPVIWPAILSGWLLAFTLSLDDVVIANFTTGPGATTLPLIIWSKVKMGVTPDINALATLIIGGVTVILLAIIITQLGLRRYRPLP